MISSTGPSELQVVAYGLVRAIVGLIVCGAVFGGIAWMLWR